MLKTYLYVTEDLEEKIKRTAKAQNKSKAEMIRTALKKGIEEISKSERNDAQVLLDLANSIQKSLKNERLPRDLSVNHDYYLWGGKKKNPRIKP